MLINIMDSSMTEMKDMELEDLLFSMEAFMKDNLKTINFVVMEDFLHIMDLII